MSFKQVSIFPSLPRTERGKFIVLGSDPKGKNFLYCNGNNVYIRDVESRDKCDIYSDHTSTPTVAAYAPTGFYIASGDQRGKVRVWDTTNEEHLCKIEHEAISGAIRDIAWDSESKRLAIAGDGKQMYAKVITFDSGNTVGSMGGHEKCANSVAFKPNRPFKLVSASEDFTTQFYAGPPFKCVSTYKEHGNFVNCVRYSPDGKCYIAVGQDGRALVFDGTTGEFQGALGGEENAHKGGIYSLAFSGDGKEVLTVSGDKTAKIWDVESRQATHTFNFGTTIADMQVGCLWQGDNIITVSLSGYINFLDKNNPSTPKRVQKGHNKAITSMAVSLDKKFVYSGASDGQIYVWKADEGSCELIAGKGHSNQVSDMAITEGKLITIGMDDTCRVINTAKNEYDSHFCSLPSQPKKLSAFPSGAVAVACINHIVIVDNGNVVFQQEVKWEPAAVAVHPNGKDVAFGGQHDMHIFEYDGCGLTGKHSIKTGDDCVNMEYSPDGAFLAVTTGSRRYSAVYEVMSSYKEHYKVTKQTGKIFSISWSPDSQHFATGSLDGSIVIRNLDTGYNKSDVHVVKDAHKKAAVQCLRWLSDNILVSASNDCCIKQWAVTY